MGVLKTERVSWVRSNGFVLGLIGGVMLAFLLPIMFYHPLQLFVIANS